MGYGLMVYAVDTVHLGSLIGCRDYQRLVKIEDMKWVQQEIEQLDENFDTYSYDEEKRVIPIVHTALTDIIMGKIPEKGYYSSSDTAASIYAYAYLLLCKVCSQEFLSNTYWYPVPLDLANQIDAIYRSGGLEYSVVSPLMEDGPLMMKLPGWPVYPWLGNVTAEYAQKTYAAMQQLDIEKLVEGQDKWTQGAIREARSWYAKVVEMNEEVKRNGINAEFALVGAYH